MLSVAGFEKEKLSGLCWGHPVDVAISGDFHRWNVELLGLPMVKSP